jgi:hypothetical protein
MRPVSDLHSLDLANLAILLTKDLPKPNDLSTDEWRSLLELFTSSRGAAESHFVDDNESLLREAYENVLEVAVKVGVIDSREKAVRNANFLASLIPDLTTESTIDEIARKVAAIVVQEIPVSLEFAQKNATSWRECSIEIIRDLRYSKNLLMPANFMAQRGVRFDDATNLRSWLQVLPALP